MGLDIKQKAFTGIKWNVVSTVYCTIVQLVKLSILTYLLDKSDFGIVAISMAVISFTDIFSELGMTVAIIHKQEITENQYSSVYWMNIIMSIVVFSMLALLSPFISSFYKEPLLTSVIPLLGIQILMNGFGKMFQTIKTKNMEFGILSKVRMLSVSIGFISTVAMAMCNLGVYSLVFGQLIQVGVNQIIFAVEGLKTIKIRFHFDFNEIRDFVRIGVYRLGSQVLDFISLKIDILLIGHFFGMEILGIYNIAKDLMFKPYGLISSLVGNVASSAFSRIQNDIESIKTNYKKVVKAISFISIIVYAAMFVFADTITAILYAPVFSDVAVFLRIFVFIGIINSINGQASILQVALGRTDIGFRWTVIRVFSYLALIWSACYFTIWSVAYSQLLLSVAFFFVYWRLVVYPLSTINLKDYMSVFVESLIVSAIISIPFVLLLNFVYTNLIVQIILGVVFLICHFVYYWFFGKEYIKLFLK